MTKKSKTKDLVTVLNSLNSEGLFSIIDWDTIAIQGIDPANVTYPKGYCYVVEKGIFDEEHDRYLKVVAE